MASTKYLLKYERKEKEGNYRKRGRRIVKRGKRVGDDGCASAWRSHAARDPYPLSKLKAPGLSMRKWTKLLMMMLHGRVEGS